VNKLPQSNPIAINRIAAGINTIMASKTLRLIVNPRKNATIKHTITCKIAIGSKGSVYPNMKFLAVSGDVNSRNINELVLSFAINMPEKSEIKDRPKTAIPGVNWSITNNSAGILDWIAVSNKSKTTGNPIPKAKLILSLMISLALRVANVSVFIR
jgi:hypothetical protein